MIVAPDLVDHLDEIDDVLATAVQYGTVLFMAAHDSAFDHDARNATHSMCDAMGEKIATARELLKEIRARHYPAPMGEKAAEATGTVPDASVEAMQVENAAADIKRLMRRIHGGDWGININHSTQFVLVSRIFPEPRP